MILLGGIPSEEALVFVRRHLERLYAPFVMFSQRSFAEADLEFQIASGAVAGVLRINGQRHSLESFHAVYLRLMDDQLLPELKLEPPESTQRQRCRALHDAMVRWSEVAPARIVNRIAAMGSNSSKPFQLQLIRSFGFTVPDTLVTDDPQRVLEFWDLHKQVVYKSISGIRSIVQKLRIEDLSRLELIRCCPTQFQQFIDGRNIRVHTIGQRLFATAVKTEAVDYRYASRQVGEPAKLSAFELSDDVAEKCLSLAANLGLEFAGIDLKISSAGEIFCFEVNPSPAFTYYESHTEQPIGEALARHLMAHR